MWALWVPAIVLWQILPVVAGSSDRVLLATPSLALTNPAILIIRHAAASVAVLAFALTVPCWLGMGSNWSMAIVPGKRCRLITDGMFSYVRHPIYALSILLMCTTMMVTLTLPMMIVGAIHITMLYLKATSEEGYLRQIHGQQYAEYCQVTERFVPRLYRPIATERDDEVRRAA